MAAQLGLYLTEIKSLQTGNEKNWNRKSKNNFWKACLNFLDGGRGLCYYISDDDVITGNGPNKKYGYSGFRAY